MPLAESNLSQSKSKRDPLPLEASYYEQPVEEPPQDEIKIEESSLASDYVKTDAPNPMAGPAKAVFDKLKKRHPEEFAEARDFGGLPVKLIKNVHTGDTYQGTVDRGVPHGWGTFVTKSGEVVEGIFVNGVPEARIRQVTADGSCFEGTFKDHKRHGKGVLIMPNGNTIKCDTWVNGNTAGSYEETDKNGNLVFKGAKGANGFDGPCKFVLPGATIEANYKNGQLAGPAKKLYSNSAAYEGVLDAKFTENGTGTITFPDGRKFEGPFLNGKPNGAGTFTSDTGKASKQTWKDGKRV